MLIDYLPIVILLVVINGFALGALVFTHLLGPRRPNHVKLSPYESGIPPIGDARLRFSIKFYLVAMLFIIFDIEATFLIPWAVVFRDLKLFGMIEMFVFIGMLVLGYIYVWRRGAFDWNR